MEIQRSPTKRKRPGRLDKKIADIISISSQIFHQIAVKILFWFSPEFGASFSLNCCHTPNASGQDYESVSPCNILQFKCCLHPILTKPTNYIPIMLQLTKITNGHNYPLLRYRSVLPQSITCLVLF